MARSPRPINAPSVVPTQPTVPTTRTRARPSVAASSAPSTPAATAAAPILSSENVASSSKSPQVLKPSVEAKTHGLRSILGEKERPPCPFPREYGGREKLGVSEEDEKDEVLMAVCAACAKMDNRALSAEEIAAIAIDEGWLRPPSAAVVPSTIINNAIRAHQKRASSGAPPRPHLLNKQQLAGSVNESVLEPALHPTAFNGLTRPKGSFWYLAQAGKTKWKNPFAGIEIPKALPRKPVQQKRAEKPKAKMPSQKTKTKPVAAIAPKVRLIIRPQQACEVEVEGSISEAEASPSGSRTTSRRNSIAPTPPIPISRPTPKVSQAIDTSDESDASDSEPEAGPSRMFPIRPRKDRPPPLPLTSSRITIPSHVSRSLGSPFLDWTGVLPDSPSAGFALNSSPFPSHSLDNTTWGVRHDRFASLETSSSSSDDEMRDSVDWGTASNILIRSVDEDESKPTWPAEDEDSKVKEATDALRVLFPMSSNDELQLDERVHLNRLDNRPTPSDTSSIAESASTTRGPLKSAEVASVALSTWNITSSPVASPNIRSLPLPDTSPTQHLSKLNHSFDASEMEIDEVWLDGELPVRADDVSSDVELDPELLSNVGDAPTPEDDKQLHTAAWARAAAVSNAFRVKEEVADYPSPMTTESDDISHVDYRASRASSQESHTPSSGLSELPPYDLDSERLCRDDIETILDGPESVSIDELDLCFGKGRHDKTPQRNRTKAKAARESDISRCSEIWGGIGVGALSALAMKEIPQSASRNRNRAAIRRRSSARTPVVSRALIDTLPTPPADADQSIEDPSVIDMDLDAIGPADLEAACAEAELREERHRKACREKAEKQKAFLDAYREKVKEAQMVGISASDVSPPEGREPFWSDAMAWGSADSMTPSALSPMALHMSNLSLDTPMYQSVDPRSLLSPPLLPANTSGFPQSLSTVESMEKSPQILPLSSSTPTILPSAQPHLKAIAPAPSKAPPVKKDATGLVPVAPRPLQPNPNGPRGTPSAVPITNAASKALTTSKPAVTAIDTAAVAELPKKTITPAGSGNSTPTSTAGKGGPVAIKLIRPGVNACVIDAIPVYTHLLENKFGKFMLVRRLDSDFVNATTLLHAFGYPSGRHAEYLDGTEWAPAHEVVGTHCPQNSKAYSAGVTGVWIPFVEAEKLITKINVKVRENDGLANFMRADLFKTFAELANLKGTHFASNQFGSPFRPEYIMPARQARSQVSTANPSPAPSVASAVSSAHATDAAAVVSPPIANAALTVSANSKSAPDLTALSASASERPRPAAIAQVKGPLIRAAPTTPEGCPQPKRRRATMSLAGEIAPLAKISPAPGSATAIGLPPIGIKKAPVRATRASIAGDTPKPRMRG